MEQQISPEKVTKPIQLLAAWLSGLIIVDSLFLAAARLLTAPAWIPVLLTIAAVGNVPLFLVCIFLLQTRFRPEMQEDAYYAQYLAGIRDSSAPLPPAVSPGRFDPNASAALAEILALHSGATVLLALGETSRAGDESAVVGAGDALAVALVQAKLLSLPDTAVTVQVVRTHRSLREYLSEYAQIVAIGGPRANSLTSALLSVNHVNFEFRPDGIYDRSEQRVYTAKFADGGMSGEDWAVLIVVANPYKPDGKAVLLAGYSGYGTNAAATIFANIESFPQLQQSISCEALVRVGIKAGAVESPELLFVRPIPTVEPFPDGLFVS